MLSNVCFYTCASICSETKLHIVFDNYLKSSVKEGERTRRVAGMGLIPQQMIKFWPSPSIKTDLQRLTRVLAAEQHSHFPHYS